MNIHRHPSSQQQHVEHEWEKSSEFHFFFLAEQHKKKSSQTNWKILKFFPISDWLTSKFVDNFQLFLNFPSTFPSATSKKNFLNFYFTKNFLLSTKFFYFSDVIFWTLSSCFLIFFSQTRLRTASIIERSTISSNFPWNFHNFL